MMHGPVNIRFCLVLNVTNSPCTGNEKQKGVMAWAPGENGRGEHGEGTVHGKSLWQEMGGKTYEKVA